MKESQVESLLQSLNPAPPSADLLARVEHELDLDSQWLDEPVTRRKPRWLAPTGWAVIGAAAAAVIALAGLLPLGNSGASRDQAAPLVSAPGTGNHALPPGLPVSTIREVVSTQDQGIRYNDQSHLPEQHLKMISVERHAWIDPRDGAQITVEVPREEHVVLPVSFQ